MVPAGFFERFGFLALPGFLDARECGGLRQMLATAGHTPAAVSEAGREYEDAKTRATHVLSVSDEIERSIHERLLALVPRFAGHFGEPLTGCRRPSFLRYQEGDFFAAHRDASARPDAEPVIRARRVSAVVFLNTPDSPGDASYSGGELTFYELFDDPALRDRGFPVQPEEGLLLAFPSSAKHEVRPVERGTRYSLVTWFTA